MTWRNDLHEWKQWCKRNWLYLAGGAAIAGAYALSSAFNDNANDNGPTFDNPHGMAYSEMLQNARHRDIIGVAVVGDTVIGTNRRGNFYLSEVPRGRDAYKEFSDMGIPVTHMDQSVGRAPSADNSGGGNNSGGSPWMSLLMMAAMAGGVIYLMRRANGKNGPGGANGLSGNFMTKLYPGHINVRFDDVAGIDEAKQELREVVDFLKDPRKYTRLGGKMPTGLLMVGPPGTGKTLTAKAIAGEAGVPFIQTSGSAFVEMYVGVGAKRVRELFESAKASAPCIIFIDEIDAIGKARGSGPSAGGSDEREGTLNQILVEMDGFGKNSGVIVVAATNRADILDAALKRPGRFDRQVHVGLPDLKGREAILKVHSSKLLTGPDVDLAIVAQGTPGFSGADLANLCNEAALLAARDNKHYVGMIDFENAKDKIMMGPERKSFGMSAEDKEMTAYHEAGHAVIGAYYHRKKLHDIPHKATIIPRGGALGLVLSLPEKDQTTLKKAALEARMVMAMGGRAAERIKYGEDNVSTGAGGDIQQASKIARAMVKNYGMSELGSVDFSENQGSLQPSLSDEMHNKIEDAVQKMVKEAEQKAYELLKGDLNPQWELMTESLLKHETLNRQQIQLVMDLEDPAKIQPLLPRFDSLADGGLPSAADAANLLSSPPESGPEISSPSSPDVSVQDNQPKGSRPPESGYSGIPRIGRKPKDGARGEEHDGSIRPDDNENCGPQ